MCLKVCSGKMQQKGKPGSVRASESMQNGGRPSAQGLQPPAHTGKTQKMSTPGDFLGWSCTRTCTASKQARIQAKYTIRTPTNEETRSQDSAKRHIRREVQSWPRTAINPDRLCAGCTPLKRERGSIALPLAAVVPLLGVSQLLLLICAERVCVLAVAAHPRLACTSHHH